MHLHHQKRVERNRAAREDVEREDDDSMRGRALARDIQERESRSKAYYDLMYAEGYL